MRRIVIVALVALLGLPAAGATAPSALARDQKGQLSGQQRQQAPPRQGAEPDEMPADAIRPAAAEDVGLTQNWYIVRTQDRGADPGKAADRLATQLGIEVGFVYRKAFNGFAAKIPPGQVAKVRSDPAVVSVRPDQPIQLAAQEVPAGIQRIGVPDNPTAKIDNVDDPLNVDVAVVDTGIDKTHPDLNYAGGRDCTGNGNPGVDGYGHGTHVAGIIAARDNDFGVVGVAPGARLWSVKVFNANGRGSERNYFCGLEWLVDNANKIEVANLSLSSLPSSRPVDDRKCGRRADDEQHKLICAIVRGGVTVVVAAGNQRVNANRVTPAAYNEVITVSAVDDVDSSGNLTTPDRMASFSNYGPDIDLAAPGVNIFSTFPGDRYTFQTGTSESAPMVAGTAALDLVVNPSRTPKQVRADLIAHREKIDLPGDKDGRDEGMVDVSQGPPWNP